MRQLHAIVCIGMLGLFAAGSVGAEVLNGAKTPVASTELHPELGKKPPRETLNRDLLALPDAERQAWIHGAMSQMAQVLAAKQPETAKCVMGWYFETGNGAELIPQALAKYPDERATSTIIAVTRLACPDA